jgi:hypothetical protein
MTAPFAKLPRPMVPLSLAYAFVAGLVLFELWAAWLMLHPNVSLQYRAYYIDHSTTCLPQPVSGEYRLGTPLSFRSDGNAQTKPVKACGWFGAYGEGTPSKGTRSMLDFALGPIQGPLTLEFTAQAADKVPPQRVQIFANDVSLGEIELTSLRQVVLAIPQSALTGQSRLHLRFDYPDAKNFERSGLGSPTQNRAIRMIKLTLRASS